MDIGTTDVEGLVLEALQLPNLKLLHYLSMKCSIPQRALQFVEMVSSHCTTSVSSSPISFQMGRHLTHLGVQNAKSIQPSVLNSVDLALSCRYRTRRYIRQGKISATLRSDNFSIDRIRDWKGALLPREALGNRTRLFC